MRSTGHIRQRTPGSWELRYSLGTDPATGKRRMATTTVKGNRRAAEKELRRLLRTLDDGSHVDPTRMTVREWLTAWLGAIREEVSPKTHERYSEIIENFLAPELGALHILKLAPVHISTAYTRWATEGRRDGKPGGLSPQSRRHIHRILKAALGRAVEQQVIARNPADVLARHLPKVERQEMKTLTAGQAARLLEAIKRNRVYWPVLVALSTGMRRGEILALRWKNIDLGCVDGFDQDEAESKRDERAVILRRLLASKCDTLEAFELADSLFNACPCLVECFRKEGGHILGVGSIRDCRTYSASARGVAV